MMGPPTILGLAHDYKNLSRWLDEELIPQNASTFRIPERSCFASYYDFDGKDTGIYFKRGFRSIWDPIPASVIEYGGMLYLPQEIPNMKLIVPRNLRSSRRSKGPLVLVYGRATLLANAFGIEGSC
jgi:hypothetical protein